MRRTTRVVHHFIRGKVFVLCPGPSVPEKRIVQVPGLKVGSGWNHLEIVGCDVHVYMCVIYSKVVSVL